MSPRLRSPNKPYRPGLVTRPTVPGLRGIPRGSRSVRSKLLRSVRRRGPRGTDHVLEGRLDGDPARQPIATLALEYDCETECGTAIGCMDRQGSTRSVTFDKPLKSPKLHRRSRRAHSIKDGTQAGAAARTYPCRSCRATHRPGSARHERRRHGASPAPRCTGWSREEDRWTRRSRGAPAGIAAHTPQSPRAGSARHTETYRRLRDQMRAPPR